MKNNHLAFLSVASGLAVAALAGALSIRSALPARAQSQAGGTNFVPVALKESMAAETGLQIQNLDQVFHCRLLQVGRCLANVEQAAHG